MTARPYQLEAVAAARSEFRRGQPSALVVLPTGAGKTRTAAEFLRQLLEVKPDYRAVVVVPRASIVDSFTAAVSQVTGITPTVAAASSHGVDTTGQFVVGMWQTLSRRVLQSVDLVVADECHRINQRDPQSGYYSLVKRHLDSGAKLLGLTATPYRQDGYIYGEGKLFPEPCFKRDLKWTNEQGFTVRAKLTAGEAAFDTSYLEIDATGDYAQWSIDDMVCDFPRLQAQVTDILARTGDRKKIAIACANIKHAQAVQAEIRSRGHDCEAVVSTDAVNERHLSLGRFEADAGCRFLSFVSIVAEGYDFPPTDCIVFLRPTRSSVFYIQCVGRGLRPAPGKTDCLVLDYGQVVRNCGPLDAPIVNRSTGKGAQLEELTALAFDIIQCKDCGAFLFPDKNAPAVVCGECGSGQPKPERVVGKNLEKRAEAEAALYEEEVEAAAFSYGEWEVVRVKIDSGTGSQAARRRRKGITLWLTDGGTLEFQVINPLFATDAGKKFFYRKLEAQMQRLVDAIAGQPVDLRDITNRSYDARARVLVHAERRVPSILHTHRPYDKYKSHRILTADELSGSGSPA